VSITVMLTALAVAGGFFVVARKRIQDQILRVETAQGLRAAMDSMLRDLRLGGACLPITGDFITLDTTNSTNDSITTRTGLVRPNETCVRTVTTADIQATTSSISVQSASGFTNGMRAYIIQASGTWGEVFTITSVNTSTNVIQKTGSFTCQGSCGTPAYPSGSGIYALDERQYAVDTTSAIPVLTLAVNSGTASQLVSGIESLQIRYQLERNCDNAVPSGSTIWPPTGCDVVDLPTATEFTLVNQMYLTLTARSRTTDSNGAYYRITRTAGAKPRNLLPGG
jgi:hypothetical protein